MISLKRKHTGSNEIPVYTQKQLLRRQRRRALHERLSTLPFLFPSLAGVLVFFVIPFLVVIYYSVLDNPISKNFVFLTNYKNLIDNSAFRMAVKNTLSFSAIAVPLAVILPLLLAVILMSNIPGKELGI